MEVYEVTCFGRKNEVEKILFKQSEITKYRCMKGPQGLHA